MINLIGKLPPKFFLAISGGMDSMVALDFFLNGKRNLTAIHFDHHTDFGFKARKFVQAQCQELNVPLIISSISRSKYPKESPEEYWRNERYKFFNSLPGPVITAQHLDDATEWWLFSSLHGEGKLTPYQNKNVIRPFLGTPKSEIVKWMRKKNVRFLEDPCNDDESYMRTIIRNNILPNSLRVNPGLRTVVKKKLISCYG